MSAAESYSCTAINPLESLKRLNFFLDVRERAWHWNVSPSDRLVPTPRPESTESAYARSSPGSPVSDCRGALRTNLRVVAPGG